MPSNLYDDDFEEAAEGHHQNEDLVDKEKRGGGGDGAGSSLKRQIPEFSDDDSEEDDEEKEVDANHEDIFSHKRSKGLICSDVEEEDEESKYEFIVDWDDELQVDDNVRRMHRHLQLLSESEDDHEDYETRESRVQPQFASSSQVEHEEGRDWHEDDQEGSEDLEKRIMPKQYAARSSHTEYNEVTTDVETSEDNDINKRAHLTPMAFGVDEPSVTGSGMATSINKFMDAKLEYLKSIRDDTTQDRNLSTRLFEELDKIPGLNEDNVIDAASIIIDSSTKTKIFFGMSNERRAYYVKSRILRPSLPC